MGALRTEGTCRGDLLWLWVRGGTFWNMSMSEEPWWPGRWKTGGGWVGGSGGLSRKGNDAIKLGAGSVPR